MSSVRTKQQTSSGGIIFSREPDGLHIALIGRTTPKGQNIWCLPKGWVEPGETLEETALREVLEETGLEGRIEEKAGDISYWFYDRKENIRIHKTVHFFLLQHLRGDTSQHDQEVEEVRWFKAEQAEDMLTYPTEKEILIKAMKTLNDKSYN